MIQDLEVVVVNVLASKDIGKEFQDGRLSDTSLSNKKDGVWGVRPVLERLDDPLFEGLDVTRRYS